MVVKGLALVIALVLMMGTVAGGTIAWLTDTSEVTNSFSFGNVDIELDETLMNPDNTPMVDENGDPVRGTGTAGKTTNTYTMYPGESVMKDPVVTVKAGSEACWLFVKLEKKFGEIRFDGVELTFDDFLEFDVITEGNSVDGKYWIPLTGYCNEDSSELVYYTEVSKTDEDLLFEVLKKQYTDSKGTPNANTVKVRDEVTLDMLNALATLETEQEEESPMLVVTAYAIQKSEGIAAVDDPVNAWRTINNERPLDMDDTQGASVVSDSDTESDSSSGDSASGGEENKTTNTDTPDENTGDGDAGGTAGGIAGNEGTGGQTT